jgi:hypothetical protein
VLSAKYERNARRLQGEINGFEKDRKKAESESKSAETALDQLGSRRLDRHWYLLWLGGDRAIYKKVVPLRKEIWQCSATAQRARAKVGRAEKDIRTCIHDGLAHGDRGYQAILASAAKEKKARESCVQLLELVGAARDRIRKAVKRPSQDADATEVADRVQAVRNHARPEHGPRIMREVRKLPDSFPGSQDNRRARTRAFTAADKSLASIGTGADSTLTLIKSREKAFEANRVERFERERARFK